MSNIKLSHRLQVIASFVDKRSIADIGCDHGKLDAYLFEQGCIDYALVSDIRPSSLDKAVSLLSSMHVHYDHLVYDGIYPYTTAQQAVICGLGGREIIKILHNNQSNIKSFVLGPQHDEVKLKKYLVKNKYHILNDIFICDNGKFYNIIKCVKQYTTHRIPKLQYYFGQDVDGSDYKLYIDTQYDKVSGLIPMIPRSKSRAMRKYLRIISKAKGVKQ